jgi:hypothetical protein
MDSSSGILLKINYKAKNILPSVARRERRWFSWWHIL